MKTAIVIFSDPVHGKDEALGRLFNALFLALELQEKQQEVEIVFQGAGTRWIGEIASPQHPAHPLYQALQERIVICGGCADIFDATARAETAAVRIIREKQIPGTNGIVDLSRYLDQGARLLTF